MHYNPRFNSAIRYVATKRGKMNFIYAIILGIIFGLSEIDFFYAFLLILLLVFVYALKDIIFKRQFITDTPSAYVLFK